MHVGGVVLNAPVMYSVITMILTLSCCVDVFSINTEEYLHKRQQLISSEYQMRTGAGMTLSDAERRVNARLMNLKAEELKIARENVTNFPPAVHFFRAKALIDDSQVFKVIRTMPKGADLHVHDSGTLDVRWLIKNATYDPNCFMCTNQSSGSLEFRFFDKPPSSDSAECDWQQVTELRTQSGDPAAFDEMLYRQMTLVVDDPENTYPTISAIWSEFQAVTRRRGFLLMYAPVFRAHFYHTLQQFYDDGIQYTELRTLLPPVYELDGSLHGSQWVLEAYVNTTQQFIREHPDFIGARFIYAAFRSGDPSSVAAAINHAVDLRTRFPGYVAGFDLIGFEDEGHPLVYFIDELLSPSQRGIDLPYFFHAGETNWIDEDVDMDLVDALLLNTSRIGHGYAVTKHPQVRQLLEKRRIALEICPISNQVLMLVKDIRNHPAAELMASNFPLVIASDDPSMWGAVGLSYDFYEAFMGLGGAWADLATLKQLAVNSIQYSSLSHVEKAAAFSLWQTKWNDFIEQSLETLTA